MGMREFRQRDKSWIGSCKHWKKWGVRRLSQIRNQETVLLGKATGVWRDSYAGGDELYIKSIDRLGRNYEEIIEQWHFLTIKKEIEIIVLDFPLLNTKEQVNGLTGKFLSDLVLQILSYVAQVERENIRKRQQEGIQIAKDKGVQFGRRSLEISDDAREILESYRNGEISSLRKCAKLIGVSHMTVAKWIKELE